MCAAGQPPAVEQHRSACCSIDTTTLGGRLVFHLFGALASFSVMSTRTVALPGVGAAA